VDYMTEAEFAEMIRTPAETARYWRYTGYGPPSFKLGRRVVYKRSDVEKWLAGRRDKAGSAA
jgi:hypothetical protein